MGLTICATFFNELESLMECNAPGFLIRLRKMKDLAAEEGRLSVVDYPNPHRRISRHSRRRGHWPEAGVVSLSQTARSVFQ